MSGSFILFWGLPRWSVIDWIGGNVIILFFFLSYYYFSLDMSRLTRGSNE